MTESIALATQRTRFAALMRRHVRPDDRYLSDDSLVRAIFLRYEVERDRPLIDPNE